MSARSHHINININMENTMTGPSLPFCDHLHYVKYRSEGESYDGYAKRISVALSDDYQHEQVLYDITRNMRFMPAGRIQAWAGSPKVVTPYNCLGRDTLILTREFGMFPIGELEDQFVTVMDGAGSWVKTKVESFGEQNLFNIRFTNGRKSKSIMATMEHGWISDGKRTTTGSVKSVDFMTALKNESADYRLGVVHGIVYGDGSATSDGGFNLRVCSDHEDICPWFEGYPTSNPPSANGDPYFYFYGKNAHCDMKALPSIGSSDQYLLGFIRGWLAADGCVSIQPEVTICGDAQEKSWLEQFGPIAGFYITGSSTLAVETNYGVRNKRSLNIRFDLRSISSADILIKRKADRLKAITDTSWRVAELSSEKAMLDKVFCVQVPTTNSFVIEGGLLSGNCFVSPTIHDSFVDGPKLAGEDMRSVSIMDAARLAAQTMRQGGGIGYDFSTLRPAGDMIWGVRAKTDGPIAFMPIFDAVCQATSSAGDRRGAEMGVMRCDHPDIMKFIVMKKNNKFLTGFNVSVGVTDELMEAVARNGTFDLRFNGRVYETVDARELWALIMDTTWQWAEPGVLFLDTINRQNNLWYCETIAATNPCGEQPLPPYGACLLGSFAVPKYLKRDLAGWYFDWDQFIADIPQVVRMMDNVIDKANYPLPQQREEATSKRRMGLGVTGLANALEAMGMPYGSIQFVTFETKLLNVLRDEAYRASIELAKEKGAFKLFDADKYLASGHNKNLPDDIKDGIRKYGIRNSHLTSIAPTGTISFTADNMSGGIEPVFAWETERPVDMPGGKQIVTVQDYAVSQLDVYGKTTASVTIEEHMAVFLAAATRVDSAVSKTVNVDKHVKFEDFMGIYQTAFEGGAKGLTTFNKDGKRFALLKDKDGDDRAPTAPECPADIPLMPAIMEGSTCTFDPVTGNRNCE